MRGDRNLSTLLVIAGAALIAALPAAAQESASYRLTEHVFNAGGHPSDGVVFASASYRVTLDAIGEGVLGRGLSSGSYRMEAGFVPVYPPPGEATGLLFSDRTTLVWSPEPSVGAYNLYRDLVSNLSGLGYGDCEQYDLPDETATDADAPPVGDGYFYLVTAANRLDEEGSKGQDSDGAERGNPDACP